MTGPDDMTAGDVGAHFGRDERYAGGPKDNPDVTPPSQLRGIDRRREARDRVVRLYELWDKAEPGRGYSAKAAGLKSTLNSTPAASSNR